MFYIEEKKSMQCLLLLKSGNSSPLKSNCAHYYDTQIHMIWIIWSSWLRWIIALSCCLRALAGAKLQVIVCASDGNTLLEWEQAPAGLQRQPRCSGQCQKLIPPLQGRARGETALSTGEVMLQRCGWWDSQSSSTCAGQLHHAHGSGSSSLLNASRAAAGQRRQDSEQTPQQSDLSKCCSQVWEVWIQNTSQHPDLEP